MRYCFSYQIDELEAQLLGDECLKVLERKLTSNRLTDLFSQLVGNNEIEQDRWYSFRVQKQKTSLGPKIESVPSACETSYFIDINPAREEIVHIKTPEETFLVPEKSFKEKVKNCVRYLRGR